MWWSAHLNNYRSQNGEINSTYFQKRSNRHIIILHISLIYHIYYYRMHLPQYHKLHNGKHFYIFCSLYIPGFYTTLHAKRQSKKHVKWIWYSYSKYWVMNNNAKIKEGLKFTLVGGKQQLRCWVQALRREVVSRAPAEEASGQNLPAFQSLESSWFLPVFQDYFCRFLQILWATQYSSYKSIYCLTQVWFLLLATMWLILNLLASVVPWEQKLLNSKLVATVWQIQSQSDGATYGLN